MHRRTPPRDRTPSQDWATQHAQGQSQEQHQASARSWLASKVLKTPVHAEKGIGGQYPTGRLRGHGEGSRGLGTWWGHPAARSHSHRRGAHPYPVLAVCTIPLVCLKFWPGQSAQPVMGMPVCKRGDR